MTFTWPHMRRYANEYVSAFDFCEERKNPPKKEESDDKIADTFEKT